MSGIIAPCFVRHAPVEHHRAVWIDQFAFITTASPAQHKRAPASARRLLFLQMALVNRKLVASKLMVSGLLSLFLTTILSVY